MALNLRGVLQEVQAAREQENDENLPVHACNIQDRPTDDDRARFGFKPKGLKSGQVTPVPPVPPVGAGAPEPRIAATPRPLGPALGAAGPAPLVDLQAVLRRTLGDPDDVLPVLRLKPTAGKYDFKDKIADLQAMINPLKNALSDQRLKAKALVEALLSMESHIDQKFRSSIEETATLRCSLTEVTEQLTVAQRELLTLRQEQPRLRSAAHDAQRREENLAEQCLEAQQRGERLERDLEEARRIARSFSEDACKYKRRCEEMGEKHRAQMEEAAELLRQQVNETIQAQQQLSEAHQKKEASLIAEFEKSKEELKKEHQLQMDDLQHILQSKEAEAKASTEALKDHYKKMLQEKDLLLKNKDSEMKTIMDDMEQTYKTAMEEKDGIMEQQENKHRRYMDELKKKHDMAMKETALLHQQKEDQMAAGQQHLVETHLAELEMKDQRMREQEAELRKEMTQKELEMKHCLSTAEQSHQQKVAELQQAMQLKEAELQQDMKRKEVEMQNCLSSSQQSHQQRIEELQKSNELKEAALNEKLQSLQKQLTEKEATLRDSFQSMQLLQNSSSDQLRLEQQRVQKLETEVEELRNRSVVHLQRLEHSDVELGTTRQQISDLRQHLQRVESEKEQQAEKASERQAVLQEQLIELNLKAKTFEEEASKLKVLLEAQHKECERLTSQRDGLEVEFRSYKEHHGTSNQQQMEAITELKLTVDKLSKQVDFTKGELQLQQVNLSQRQGYIISLENQLAKAEVTRRELHNIIQELKGNIRVFCRVRPADANAATSSLQTTENKMTLEHLSETYNFGFDRVFDNASTQEAIFDEVSGLVQSALDGYKVCIFAYGQTGSGKTFTMQGEPASASTRGLIPRCLSKILQCSEQMRTAGWEWTMKVSFLEVYNEVLRDLLDSEQQNQWQHVIKHDEAYGTMVTNVTSVEVKQMEHINRLMEKAAKARAVGATDMNATSSRSHSIFAMYLHGINRELNCELTGALHLVDLAGSERLEKSGSTGDRLKETQNINKSLSSLADVFMAKAEGRSHIPFRNSKLTHLMEPCLNGQGKTLMVVNVAPEAEHTHETLCSLRFASQVSQCNTGGKPKRNVRPAVGSRQAAPTTRRK